MGWGGFLRSLLQRGIAEGSFRADLDVDATARIVMGFFKALGAPPHDPVALERPLAQLEAWILTDNSASRRKARRATRRSR